MATATAIKSAPEEKKFQPIPRDRMRELSQDTGPRMSIVLEGDQTIEAGPQDCRRWEHIGSRLTMYQELRVTNDAGTFIRRMEVLAVHGTPGSGLRFLNLGDTSPPVFIDKANEPIVSTGDWFVRWGGLSKKWQVIRPNGQVRQEGINTEAEARNVLHLEAGNPRP